MRFSCSLNTTTFSIMSRPAGQLRSNVPTIPVLTEFLRGFRCMRPSYQEYQNSNRAGFKCREGERPVVLWKSEACQNTLSPYRGMTGKSHSEGAEPGEHIDQAMCARWRQPAQSFHAAMSAHRLEYLYSGILPASEVLVNFVAW
jgi:hypothetical protein